MLTIRDGESIVVPAFPLPNAVLFPHTVLPLHVFEPRYRAMVRDVMMDDRPLIVIVLLKPGYEKDYAGSPAIHSIGTVGRVEELRPQSDGCFQFNLVGLQRVELEEVDSTRPYRQVRITARPDVAVNENDPEIDHGKLELLASHGMLMRELTDESAAGLVLNDQLEYSAAINGSCANLPTAPEVRQELLELDDPRSRQRRALHVINHVLEEVLKLKDTTGADAAYDVN